MTMPLAPSGLSLSVLEGRQQKKKKEEEERRAKEKTEVRALGPFSRVASGLGSAHTSFHKEH